MKILHLNMEKGWRGGERQTLLSLQKFKEAGHDVFLWARHGGVLAERAKEIGIPVLTHKKSYGPVLFFLRGKARSFDIVHCQTSNTLTWAAFCKWLYRAKLVFTRRTAFPVKHNKTRSTQFKWKQCDLFAAVSKGATLEPIRLGIKPVIIYSAVEPTRPDLARALALKEKFQIPTDKKVIGVVAALTSEKDPDTLIQAIALLHKTRQDFVVMHFGSGHLLTKCQEQIQKLGLGDCYYLMGFHPNIENLYIGFDVLAQSSLYEGLGNSISDAFLQKIPVVSTASSGSAELLADGRGFLCPVGNAQQLAQAIDQTLDPKTNLGDMIEKSYRFASDNFNSNTMAQHYLEAYRQLINKPQNQTL